MIIYKKNILVFLNILSNFPKIEEETVLIKVNKKKKYFFLNNNLNSFLFFYKNREEETSCLFYIKYKILYNLIKNIDKKIEILKVNKKILIKNNSFLLSTYLNVKKKKTLEIRNCNYILLKSKKLVECIKFCLPTLKLINNRNLGLNFVFKNKILKTYSSDGFRISKALIKIKKNKLSKTLSFNLNKKSVLFIVKLIEISKKKYLKLFFDNGKIMIIINNFVYASSEISYIKHDYSLLYDKKKYKKIKINRIYLLKSLMKISSISDEINNIDLCFYKNNIYLNYNNGSSDKATDHFKIRAKIKKKLKIRLNFQFLIDFLKLKNYKNLSLYIRKRNKKVILRFKKFIYFLMPIVY
ncbi:hypothetical protein [Candidatus Vidania fulgoroideorum]